MASAGSLNSRLCDTGDNQEDPRRVCNPIRGLDKVSVMTVSEAVNPLEDHVPYIRDFAYFALQFADQVDDKPEGMTRDEIAALNLYTRGWDTPEDSLYYKLNQHLRSEDRTGLKPYFPVLKLILTALNKLPCKSETVWRGVRADIAGSYKIGRTSTWWGFSSCTLDMKTLEMPMFLGKTGDRTLFNIETRSGRSICSFSQFKKEAEIILPPGIFVQITNVFNAGHGLNIVQLKEINSPVPAIDFVVTKAEEKAKQSMAIPAPGAKSKSSTFDLTVFKKAIDQVDFVKATSELSGLQPKSAPQTGETCCEALLYALASSTMSSAPKDDVVAFVFTTMQNFAHSSDVVDKCLRILNSLSLNNEQHRAITKKWGIGLIITGMKQHILHAGVQEKGCQCLWNLSDTPENKTTVAQKGGIDLVLTAMKQHPNEAAVQHQGCGALWCLCTKTASNRQRIFHEGGLDLVLGAIQTHEKHSGVQVEGLGALWELSLDSNLSAGINQERAIDLILTALKSHSHDAEVHQIGFGTLNCFSQTAGCQVDIAQRGGIALVTQGLSEHSHHNGVQRYGYLCLYSLAKDSSNRTEIVRRGGVEAIVSGMAQNIQYGEVQKEGCKVIWELAVDAENKPTLGKKGAIDVILSGMETHSKHPGVQHQGCGALWCLSDNHDDNARAVVSKKGTERVLHAVGNHSSHGTVLIEGFGALVQMGKVSDPGIRDTHKATLARDGGIDVILRGMQVKSHNASVQKYGCEALATLSDFQGEMFANGCVDVLLSTVKHHMKNADVILGAGKVLELLTKVPEATSDISKKGGTDTLKAVVKIYKQHKSIAQCYRKILEQL